MKKNKVLFLLLFLGFGACCPCKFEKSLIDLQYKAIKELQKENDSLRNPKGKKHFGKE